MLAAERGDGVVQARERVVPGRAETLQERPQHDQKRDVAFATPVAHPEQRALRRRQLVAPVPGEAGRYRYDSAWDASGERIAEVAAVYARKLVQVATFIHSRGSSAVREFARAFDLKRER